MRNAWKLKSTKGLYKDIEYARYEAIGYVRKKGNIKREARGHIGHETREARGT